MVKKEIENDIIDVNTNWIFIRTKLLSHSYVIGLIYLKPNQDLHDILDDLQLILDKCENLYANTPIILGGDFNARLGEYGGDLPAEALIGSNLLPKRCSQDKVTSTHGLALLNYMSSNELFLLNGRMQEDDEDKLIFYGPQGASVIDLVWTNYKGSQMITTLQVGDDSHGSDHFLIRVKTTTNIAHSHPRFTRIQSTYKLNWKPELAYNFTDSLYHSHRLHTSFEDSDVDHLASNLLTAIHEAADSAGLSTHIKTRTGTRATKKPWEDQELKMLRARLTKQQKICRQSGFTQ